VEDGFVTGQVEGLEAAMAQDLVITRIAKKCNRVSRAYYVQRPTQRLIGRCAAGHYTETR
jgi:hypothetical protein